MRSTARKVEDLILQIRKAAEERQYTQKSLAQAAKLHPNTISGYYQGNYIPALDSFIKLAHSVGLEVTLTPIE